MKTIVQILGPTGAGKSQIALRLAKRFEGEIISADSMQVYKGFDIGTDKTKPDRQQGIIHHLIDIIDDCSQFNAQRFLVKAYEATQSIMAKNKRPFVCGGTALYMRAMIRGLFPEKTSPKIRKELTVQAEKLGLENLWNELVTVDSRYAAKIGKNDRIRIIRALEIFKNSGTTPSEIFKKNRRFFADFHFIRIGLFRERPELYQRIEARLDRMISQGLVSEVERLLQEKPHSCPPFQSVGYKEIRLALAGKLTMEAAVDLAKQHTRNLAKRQLSWLRQEKDISWFRGDRPEEIESFLEHHLWNES